MAGAPIFDALTDIWESTPAIAQQYAVFHAELRAVGQIIPTNDIWIAATAYVHNAVVVTTDPHFQRLTELSVIDWTKPLKQIGTEEGNSTILDILTTPQGEKS